MIEENIIPFLVNVRSGLKLDFVSLSVEVMTLHDWYRLITEDNSFELGELGDIRMLADEIF